MKKILIWIGRLFSLAAGFALLATLIDPRVFWVPSIVSPVFPWILLCLFLLTIWLGYRRQYREALLPLLILVLALPALKKTIAWSSPDEATPIDSFRLVTANILNLKSAWEDHYPLDENGVTQLVNTIDADVVLFQEFGNRSEQEFAAHIQKSGQFSHRYKAKGSMAVFSRYPLRLVSQRFFENSTNGYLCMDLETPQGPLRLFGVHLQTNRVSGMANKLEEKGQLTDRGSWGQLKRMFGRYGRSTRTRTAQAETISGLIAESPHPVIVAGDFNDVPTSFPYRYLRTPRLRDAWLVAGRGLGATFAGAIPGLRIDYTLVDTSLLVKNVEVLPHGDSDHHPIAVEVGWK